MGVQITIRDLDESVRDKFAARAARRGRSIQEHLRNLLQTLAAKLASEDWLHGVRQRKALSRTRVFGHDIVDAR